VHALDTVAGVAHCIDLPSTSAINDNLSNMVVSLRDHDRTLAVDWRTGRPWLRVAVGSWRISRPGTAGFPWVWVGAGIGVGLALLAAGALLLRRRRQEELEQHAGQELGLA
jgi:LPXTG-motif cell wall-anchored protein